MMRASSGAARSSSAVIALTVPAVPTGMNTGVGISPRGVWSTPARAWPSVATSSNENPGVGSAWRNALVYHVSASAAPAVVGDTIGAITTSRVGLTTKPS